MGNKIIQGQLEISGNLLVNGEEAATKGYVQDIVSSSKELITIDESWINLEETEIQQDEWNSWVVLTIPEEYRDVERLRKADLTAGSAVYQLNTEDNGSLQYQYIKTWNEAPAGTAVSFQYIWLHTNNWSGVMSEIDLPAAVARMEINNGEPTTATLSSLYFGGTNYAVGEGGSTGTLVEANPELSGSEVVLTGIAIDGTNYRMPEVTVDETYVSDSLSNFMADEVEPRLENKQDTLVSGTNIKTINGESVLGSGDISVEGGSSVIANPTLSGSEADLTSITIDGTNYQVSSGSSLNIVPITESLTWDETPVVLTKERYDELMAASHISVPLEESTLIFNATAQNNGLKTFISTILESSLYCFVVVLMEDPEATYNLMGARTLLTTNPTTLISGNIPVAIDGGMIEDSGIVADNIVTTDILKNKITFIVNEDNTLDLIIN